MFCILVQKQGSKIHLGVMTAIPSGPVTTLPSVIPLTEYSTVTPARALLFTAFMVLMLMVTLSVEVVMGLVVMLVAVVVVEVVLVEVVVVVVVLGKVGTTSRIHH